MILVFDYFRTFAGFKVQKWGFKVQSLGFNKHKKGF